MKKSNLKIMLKNKDNLIAEQALSPWSQHNTIQKYKCFIKDLEHQLFLSGELAERKDNEIKKLHIEIVKNKVKIPFTKETEYALFCAEHTYVKKEVIDAPATFSKKIVMYRTNFSSSFNPFERYTVLEVCDGGKFYIVADSNGVKIDSLMPIEDSEDVTLLVDLNRFAPDVVFKIPSFLKKEFFSLVPNNDYKIGGKFHKDFHCASFNSYSLCFDFYTTCNEDSFHIPFVSIYEAIPELVPEGMFYDKESYSLVKSIGQESLYVDGELKYKRPIKDLTPQELVELDIKKEIVDAPASFSSHYMPNVKFKVDVSNKEHVHYILNAFGILQIQNCSTSGYCNTSENGYQLGDFHNKSRDSKKKYDDSMLKEVSIYEAIPELVPDGMAYVKTTDELLPILEGNDTPAEPFLSGEEVVLIPNTSFTINSSNDRFKYEVRAVEILLAGLIDSVYGDDVHILDSVSFSRTHDSKEDRKSHHTISFDSLLKR